MTFVGRSMSFLRPSSEKCTGGVRCNGDVVVLDGSRVRNVGVVEEVRRGWGRVVGGCAVIQDRICVSGVKVGELGHGIGCRGI